MLNQDLLKKFFYITWVNIESTVNSDFIAYTFGPSMFNREKMQVVFEYLFMYPAEGCSVGILKGIIEFVVEYVFYYSCFLKRKLDFYSINVFILHQSMRKDQREIFKINYVAFQLKFL
jgi:hypothetical protein